MPKYKVVVKKNPRIWGWRLRIVDNKTVEITTGLFQNWEKIVEERRGWIEKRLAIAKKSKSIRVLKKISILGDEYKVNISLGSNDSLNIFKDKKEIYIRSKKVTEKYLKKLIDQKMRPVALKIIREEVNRLAERHKIKIGGVKIKNQKTRFGSCSSRGNLNYNWQIILFPTDKFQHIILHELCHILIKNHSAQFWDKLKEMDTNCVQNNRWLKKEGVGQFIV